MGPVRDPDSGSGARILTAVVGLELPRQLKSFLDYFDPSELARPRVERFPP